MRLHKKSNGFTLIELVITLSILTIVASFALPTIHSFQSRQEFSHLVHLMRQQLNLARSHAVTVQSDIVMCASSNLITCQNEQWHQGILLYIDTNRNQKHDPNELIISSISTQLKYGSLHWHGNASHPHQVIFQSDTGLPRGSMGHFSYCNFDQTEFQRDLAIGMMGHLNIIQSAQCK